jgi:enoyl-CoA hydratase
MVFHTGDNYMPDTVLLQRDGSILTVTINRPHARNAVDSATAMALDAAFRDFDHDESLSVSVLTGAQGAFCAGADLREVATGNRKLTSKDTQGPLGPTWTLLSKPVIAAVEGHAVAGGLELALWCDMRVAARDAVFGVYCRRFGVPLIDLGTVRLPRLIGQSHALDLILTGRGVSGDEALHMGLANRLVEPGQALAAAQQLARSLAELPQQCMRSDRLSAYEQWGLSWQEARRNEFEHGLKVLESGETVNGARRFAAGAGRHGAPE